MPCLTEERRQICFVVDCHLCSASLENGDMVAHFATTHEGAVQAVADGWHRLPDGRLVCTRSTQDHEAARRIVLPDDSETRAYMRLLNRRADLLERLDAMRAGIRRPNAIDAELDRIHQLLRETEGKRPDLCGVQPDLPAARPTAKQTAFPHHEHHHPEGQHS
ncbi:hypothetical protein [Streptomyces sp. NPDC001205]